MIQYLRLAMEPTSRDALGATLVKRRNPNPGRNIGTSSAALRIAKESYTRHTQHIPSIDVDWLCAQTIAFVSHFTEMILKIPFVVLMFDGEMLS